MICRCGWHVTKAVGCVSPLGGRGSCVAITTQEMWLPPTNQKTRLAGSPALKLALSKVPIAVELVATCPAYNQFSYFGWDTVH